MVKRHSMPPEAYRDLTDAEAADMHREIARCRREYKAAHKAAVSASMSFEASKIRLTRAEDELAAAWKRLTDRVGQPFIKDADSVHLHAGTGTFTGRVTPPPHVPPPLPPIEGDPVFFDSGTINTDDTSTRSAT